jgi:hypothetical protein
VQDYIISHYSDLLAKRARHGQGDNDRYYKTYIITRCDHHVFLGPPSGQENPPFPKTKPNPVACARLMIDKIALSPSLSLLSQEINKNDELEYNELE